MTTSDWQKIKDVFARVLEQPAERRGEFLGAACGESEELRREVESLLAAYDETEYLLEKKDYAASSALAASPDVFYGGKQFGNYRIVREIGRGGMGAVFLAERADGEFDQQVALKIVARSIADPEIARRFRQERQILAFLNHPNIARLVDGGVSASGEPFLVMEYVEGERIDEFCRRENLTTRERLKLFLKVCRAVAFAHQNLVVHRDLKPSNILVTKSGEPKLLDFGIAKLLGENGAENERTQTVYRAFTPEYASPEQKRGENITTASDVYSLGVLLEEILTGAAHGARSKNDGRGWQSNRSNASKHRTVKANLVTEQESEIRDSKSKTRNSPDAELKNIAAFARREEAARRYASVAQLAEDVERYLDGLPVRAQRDSFTYRAEKFVARNRVAVGAGAFMLLALVAGFGGALWEARAARIERDRAERRFADVRRLSNALLTDIAPKIERLPGATEARASLVVQSLVYLDSLAREAESDDDLQAELAAAYEKIGDLQGNPANPNFVEFDHAIESYAKANSIRQKLFEKNPNAVETRKNLAENLRAMGNIYSFTNDADESLKNTSAALRIYETLAAEQPASIDLRFNLARAAYDAGLNLQTGKKYADALPFFERAENLLAEIDREKPRQTETLKTLGECKAQLANALSWSDKQTEAEAKMAEARRIFEPLLAENPNDAGVRGGMWLTLWLSTLLYQDQNDRLAYEFGAKAVKIADETVEKDRANVRARQQLAKSFSTLGETATTVGKSAEAIKYLENACRIQREIIEKTTKNNRLKSELALSLMRLGTAKTRNGFALEAVAPLAEAENIFVEILQAAPDDRRSSRNLAMVFEQIAETNEKLFQSEKAENYRQTAKLNYGKSLDILARLDSTGALADADRKFLNKMKDRAARF